MFTTFLFKQKRNFYNTFVKNNFVNMSTNKKRLTVLNEDEILAVEVKMFPACMTKAVVHRIVIGVS